MKVKIEKLDHFGRGITYVNDKICFVENALPGEIIKIKIIKETKKYFLAEAVDFDLLSDDRVEYVCPYASSCGGCNLQHLSFEKENEFKYNKLKEILKKFGGVSEDKVKGVISVNEYAYRNKVVLHGKDKVIGYYEKNTNKVISVDECFLVDEKMNKVIDILNQVIINNRVDEALIRCSNSTSRVMVSIKGVLTDYSLFENVIDTLIVNDEVIFGRGAIISNIGDKKFYVSDESFFQVNKGLTEFLYDEVLNVVKEIKPSRVLDLYCGTGTIGIYISDYVDRVVGVDYSKSGIEDAKKNNLLNNTNVEFICDKVENVIDRFSDIDLVIVDPPRSGLDSKTIENICRIKAKKVVYVSCDPVTLSRDLKILANQYEISYVKGFNMFPRTYHVESVAILNLRI